MKYNKNRSNYEQGVLLMEKELEILTHIQDNENITQREIAEKQGFLWSR